MLTVSAAVASIARQFESTPVLCGVCSISRAEHFKGCLRLNKLLFDFFPQRPFDLRGFRGHQLVLEFKNPFNDGRYGDDLFLSKLGSLSRASTPFDG